MDRYQVWGDNDNCEAIDPNGRWVKREDVEALLAAHAREVASLRAAIIELGGVWEGQKEEIS